MSRSYGKVSISLWRSRKFRPTSDSSKLFYMYLHTCPHVNSIGCFWLPKGYIMADLGWDNSAVDRAITELSERKLIGWNEDEEVMSITQFLEHSSITNMKHAAGAVKHAVALPDCDLKVKVINELSADKYCKDTTELKTYLEGLNSPINNTIPTETETETETELELETETETDNIHTAFRMFVDVAEKINLPVPQKLSGPRKSKLKARLKDCGGLEGWKIALTKLAASPFCRGERTDFKADLDFMLQEKSFTKLMEGSYDDRTPPPRNSPPNGSRTGHMTDLL